MKYLRFFLAPSLACVLALFAVFQSASANMACIQQLAAAGNRNGFDTNVSNSEVSVVGRSIADLAPLWSQLEGCLNGVYAKQRTGIASGRGPYKFRQWFNEVGGRYHWCASQVPAPGKLSDDPKNQEYAIWVRCGTNAAQLPNGLF